MDDYDSPFNDPSTSPIWGAEPPERRTSWPTVFGVIGIIYASLGLLGGCCSVLYPFIMPAYIDWMKQMGVPQKEIDAMQTSAAPDWWVIMSGVVGLALAALLLAGSIQLLRRRRQGAHMCALWAWISIVWTVIAIAGGAVVSFAGAATQGPMYLASAVGGLCCGAIIGLVLPVLLLIWLNRPVIKAEIAHWP